MIDVRLLVQTTETQIVLILSYTMNVWENEWVTSGRKTINYLKYIPPTHTHVYVFEDLGKEVSYMQTFTERWGYKNQSL